MRSMRAQVTVDFLIVLVAVSLLFASVFSVFLTKTQAMARTNAELAGIRVAEKVASEAQLLVLDGNGSTATVFLHALPTNENYTLYLSGRFVSISLFTPEGTREFNVPLPANVSTAASKRQGEQLALVFKEGLLHAS